MEVYNGSKKVKQEWSSFGIWQRWACFVNPQIPDSGAHSAIRKSTIFFYYRAVRIKRSF